jgi:hypothetical protein
LIYRVVGVVLSKKEGNLLFRFISWISNIGRPKSNCVEYGRHCYTPHLSPWLFGVHPRYLAWVSKNINSVSILNQSKTSSNCARKYMSDFLVSYCRWELQTFCSGKHLQECVRFQSNLNLNHFSVLLFFLLIRLIKDNKKKGCRGCFFLCACISTFLLIQHQYVSLCLEFDFILENAQKKKPTNVFSKP